MSGSSGVWRRSHGRTSEAPPNERGGNRYLRPTATAPHLDSTLVLLVACCAPKPDGPITAAFDGIYKGNGYSVSPLGWDCPNVQPANTLTVSGGYATIADLRGWVAPSGVATLSSQIAQLQGQFQGRHFEGRLQFHERGSDRLTCAYTLKLDRVG
jgi:hypothetical protein